MKLRICIIILLTNLFSQVQSAEKEICPVIPQPLSYSKEKGELLYNNLKKIVFNTSDLLTVAQFLQKEMQDKAGISLLISTETENTPTIFLELSDNAEELPQGGYTLKISPGGIKIKAVNAEGAFYGVNSLLQFVRLSLNGKIDCWQIEDRPGLQWRGLMLDEARHFFGKQTVKEIIDWMAFYKLNRFHWHLTDEQGWRIEIKKYPKLTTIGGIGNYTNSNAKAAYYKQEDITEIVQYASERFIEIIPEIDMPGHANAANRAYPEYSGGLSDQRGEYTFNPGKEETYSYLTDILQEVKNMFPFGMIHIGGDEVRFGNQPWITDLNVQQLMVKENLKDLKEVEKYFVRRMADSLKKINREILGWDEIADANLSTDSTVIFWWRYNHENPFKEALGKGYKAVLCPQIPFYIDFVQDSEHSYGRRKADGSISSTERIYNFSLKEFSDAITDENRHLVLGIQANLWAERVRVKDRLEYMLYPRMAALAETAWKNTDAVEKNYEEYKNRLGYHLELYRQEGIKFYNVLNPGETPEITPGGSPVSPSLPVELLTFTAGRKGNNVILEWKTVAEHNSSHFNAERSADGFQYDVIKTIYTKENTTAPKYYSVIDYHPVNGTNYYRLVQYDKDGNYTAYAPQAINISNETKDFTLLVSEDPRKVFFSVNSSDNGTATVSLHTSEGKKITAQKIKQTAGYHTYTINTPWLATGVYTVMYQSGKNTYREKMLK